MLATITVTGNEEFHFGGSLPHVLLVSLSHAMKFCWTFLTLQERQWQLQSLLVASCLPHVHWINCQASQARKCPYQWQWNSSVPSPLTDFPLHPHPFQETSGIKPPINNIGSCTSNQSTEYSQHCSKIDLLGCSYFWQIGSYGIIYFWNCFLSIVSLSTILVQPVENIINLETGHRKDGKLWVWEVRLGRIYLVESLLHIGTLTWEKTFSKQVNYT